MRAPKKIAGYDPHRDAAGFYFDKVEADRRVRFFERVLTHVTGRKMREPIKLEKVQKDWIATLFGWKSEADHLRRYRTAFFLLPRKNTKSTLAAGIALACLHLDNEGGAQCFCAAADRTQAGIVYDIAAGMTRQSPALASVSKIRSTVKKIIIDSTRSFLWAVPANEATLYGHEPHVIVGDEIHVWRDREVYTALHTGTISREQPLEIFISTAAEEGESPLYDEFYNSAVACRDGSYPDPRFLPVLYEASPDDDWKSPKTWKKANPLYGVSVRQEYLERECEAAKESPAKEQSFKRLHLNMAVSSIARWLAREHWSACPATERPIDGDNVVGGLDLSSTTDLTSWCLYDPESCRMRWRYWLPHDRLDELADRDRVPYRSWADAGLLTTCAGRVIDQEQVTEQVIADCEEFGVRLVAIDPWQAKWIGQELDRQYGDGYIFEASQGIAKINEPTQELGRLVTAHLLDHGNNPISNWCAANLAVKVDVNRNVQPKKNIDRKRIDGMAAAINAISAALAQPPAPPCYYDDHELEMA